MTEIDNQYDNEEIETVNVDPINEPMHVISDNLVFLEWYFKGEMNILDEREKQRIFSFMTYSIVEDPHCFLRIMMYIANTRHTTEQELFYKIVIHFLGTMFPEIALANLQRFIDLGKKDDVLYFLQCPSITERVITWIKHKAKSDVDFAKLLDGTVIGDRIKRQVRYKPKLKKNNKWHVFLFKVLDDPIFNGISA